MRAEDWQGLAKQVRIEAGAFVSAGDRFETVRPGYQVVRDQMAAPRRWVAVQSLSLSADGRTLVLRVLPQYRRETYAIALPLPVAWQTASSIAQVPEIDVQLRLDGVVAKAQDGTIVWPHPSPAVAQALTTGSAEHEAFFARLATDWQISAQIERGNISQPATQPGSTLDWDIALDAFANQQMKVVDAGDGSVVNENAFRAHTGSRFVYQLGEHTRAIALNRVHLPWSQAGQPAADATTARTDVHGNWLHGRRLYFGKAACWTCHTLRDEGLAFGPDLTNLIHRDRESMLKDVMQPSATLNPDHTGSTIELTDGTALSGIIAAQDARHLTLCLPAGVRQQLAKTSVAKITPMKVSLMPEGLLDALSETEREDLATFLLTNPLEPAPITRVDPGPPPARTMAEVRKYFPMTFSTSGSQKPLRLLLSAGKKDHGLNEHDYPLWLDRWSRLLALADNVTVSTCEGFPSRAKLAEADVTVFFSNNAG